MWGYNRPWNQEGIDWNHGKREKMIMLKKDVIKSKSC